LASVRKYRGKWQATIRRKGRKSISRTFSTKGAACTFARRVEFEMDVAQNPDDISTLSQITLVELITRYRDTVTPTKKGVRQETSRMNYILKQPISQLTLDRLTTGVFARYRDDRLQQVGPQKVRHELNAFLRTAKLDWHIPLRDIPIDHIRLRTY
jgi:hypothetical protein